MLTKIKFIDNTLARSKDGKKEGRKEEKSVRNYHNYELIYHNF